MVSIFLLLALPFLEGVLLAPGGRCVAIHWRRGLYVQDDRPTADPRKAVGISEFKKGRINVDGRQSGVYGHSRGVVMVITRAFGGGGCSRT